MKILITGITGFVGSHLAEYCLQKSDVQVFGTVFSNHLGDELKRIETIKDNIELFECNLTNRIAVQRVLERVKPDKIFHLAAQSFVPTSWQSPEDTLFNNIMSELNIFEVVRELKINPVIQIAGCYDKGTRAFTDSGLKLYKDLKKTDKVLSINPVTGEVSFKNINKIIIENYNGRMLNFKSKSCDLMVTPNHKMLVKKKKGTKPNFVRADELRGKNILCLGETKSKKRYFGNNNDSNNDLYYLIGLFIGDGYISPCKKTLVWSGLSHNEYIKNRNVKGQFIGVKKKKIKEYTSNRIFLAIPKGDKAREKAEKTLDRIGIKYSKYDKELYFSYIDNDILEIFKKCGKYARNKRIPKILLNSNKKCLISLFSGLIDSDGNYRKDKYNYSTVSKGLVEDIIELCTKIGKWITINERRRKVIKIKNRVIKSSKSYELSITDGEKILTKATNTNKKEVNYNGIIWCVEVKDNHNLLVERKGRVAFCGNSSEEYGLVFENELPVKEENMLRPLSPYGVSKVTQDTLACQYFYSYGLKTVVTRAFNHEGPRRGEQFVTSSFAKQIAQIEKGEKEPIMYVGNLEAKRDYLDVRDVVEAYWLASEKCKFGEPYNICSGKYWTIQSVLDFLLSKSTNRSIEVQQDLKRMRPSDVQILLGDCMKFKNQTGWEPKISFEKTLEDTLTYWRENI